MKNEIKITVSRDENTASVCAWKGSEIIASGMVMDYRNGRVECFGKGIRKSFYVESIDRGIIEIRQILINNIADLRLQDCAKRLEDSINKNVNQAAHLMSLRIAKFRADLFEQHNKVWKRK